MYAAAVSKSVSATLNCMALSKLLLMLEGALKSEALAPTWTLHRGAWRGRVEVAHLPRELDANVRELEHNIQWHRIMQAELAAGLGRAPSTGLHVECSSWPLTCVCTTNSSGASKSVLYT